MNTKADAERLGAAEYGALYTLLGRFFLLEIDAGALELLRSPNVAPVLAALEPGIETYVGREWTERDYDDAAAEYCALFVLPKGVTLNAPYWIPGPTEEVGHQLTRAVGQVLTSFGLSVESLPMGNVPMDNIGMLLALAGYLYQLDDPDAARYGREFVTNFVVPFAPGFTQAMLERAENPVYRAMARLFSELVAELNSDADAEQLGS